MSSPSINSNLSEPRRKQGVCLTSNPVLQDRFCSFGISSNNGNNINVINTPCYQSKSLSSSLQPVDKQLQMPPGSRQQCDFITFKALASNQERQFSNKNEMRDNARSSLSKESELMKETSSKQLAGPIVDRQLNNFNSARTGVDQDGFQTISLASDQTAPGDRKILPPLALTKSNNGNGFFADRGSIGHFDGEPTLTRIDKKLSGAHDEKPPPFKFAGIIGTLMTSFCFSLSTLCIKLLPDSNSVQDKVKALWFRGVILALLSSCSIIYKRDTFLVKRDEIWILFVRSITGCIGALGGFVSLHYITIGECTALVYSSPVWTSLFSYVLLKEPLPMTLLLALPIGLLGIVLIAEPDLILSPQLVEIEVMAEIQRHEHFQSKLGGDFGNIANQAMNTTYMYLTDQSDSLANSSYYSELQPHPSDEHMVVTGVYLEERWPGVVMALGCSLILTITCIVLKFRKSTSIQLTTFYLGLTTVMIATLVQCIIGFGRWPTTLIEYLLLLSIGFSSWIGQALFQWALMYEKASICSTIRTVDVVMSFMWSALFLKEDILWTSILGAAIIALIVIVLMLNDYIEQFMCSRCKKQ